MNRCRFCDDWRDQGLVKYGTRHYAHFRCYLQAGKTLDALPRWKVEEFPFFLLQEYGLLDHPKVVEARARVKQEVAELVEKYTPILDKEDTSCGS